MEPNGLTMLLILLLSFLVYVVFFSRSKRYSGRRLPPGSLGLPLIGQSFELMKALKDNKIQEWSRKRIAKHGPIWKATVFAYPTVVLHGLSANKFVFACDETILTNTQPPSVSRMLGINNILELTGDDHKRVRGALVSFLKIDVLKQYVAKVDEEIQNHLKTHWHGKDEVQVQILMRTLTFNVICSLLFGIQREAKREEFLPLFNDIIKGFIAFPVNLPFTQFSRGLKARKKLVTLLVDLIQEKRDALDKQKEHVNPHADLITSLLSIRDKDKSTMMSDEEIIDNIIIVMVAGYDTTSILLTFLVRILANNESIYSNIVQEQEEISKSKAPGEALTWEDLTKMNYTWRVASEMLRINAPVSVNFRRAAKDIEYGGYLIPKGWQVMLLPTLTHMDDSIFQNPTMFDPARFDQKHRQPPPAFSFLAFGAGRRMCPGMELAKIETLAMIHYMVTLFKWELLKKDESFKRVPLPEFDQGLLIRIRPIKKALVSHEV